MIHLDTHVVVWLYAGQEQRLTKRGRELLETEPTGISPVVLLELGVLHEIGRVADPPQDVVDRVRAGLDLQTSTARFSEVVAASLPLTWTRDPFDRLILATARVDGVRLLTRDRALRREAPEAVWP